MTRRNIRKVHKCPSYRVFIKTGEIQSCYLPSENLCNYCPYNKSGFKYVPICERV